MYGICKKLEPLLVLGIKYCVHYEVYKKKKKSEFRGSFTHPAEGLCYCCSVTPIKHLPLVTTAFGHDIYY